MGVNLNVSTHSLSKIGNSVNVNVIEKSGLSSLVSSIFGKYMEISVKGGELIIVDKNQLKKFLAEEYLHSGMPQNEKAINAWVSNAINNLQKKSLDVVLKDLQPKTPDEKALKEALAKQEKTKIQEKISELEIIKDNILLEKNGRLSDGIPVDYLGAKDFIGKPVGDYIKNLAERWMSGKLNQDVINYLENKLSDYKSGVNKNLSETKEKELQQKTEQRLELLNQKKASLYKEIKDSFVNIDLKAPKLVEQYSEFVKKNHPNEQVKTGTFTVTEKVQFFDEYFNYLAQIDAEDPLSQNILDELKNLKDSNIPKQDRLHEAIKDGIPNVPNLRKDYLDFIKREHSEIKLNFDAYRYTGELPFFVQYYNGLAQKNVENVLSPNILEDLKKF